MGAYWFGFKGGIIFSAAIAIAYIPHIFIQWSSNPHESFTQYVEIIMFLIIGSLLGVLSDIQRLKNFQLREANERIVRMDRLSLLGQLAAGLAHEIRNPLGSLIGSAEIIEGALGVGHQKYEFAQIMKKELLRLRDKLNEFLKFARPASPNIVPNHLNDVVHSTVTLAEKQAVKMNCRIALALDENMPIVPIDAEQIGQILLNLLLNAVQAMPGGGTVTVSTGYTDKALVLDVRDEGPGLEPGSEEKIFEPFYTKKTDGTGLGLAIAKQLVEGMNGTLTVAPSERGARFVLRIPHG
jgi:signal transduction histidine kinase